MSFCWRYLRFTQTARWQAERRSFVFVAGCGESSCSFGDMLAVVALGQFAELLGAKRPGC